MKDMTKKEVIKALILLSKDGCNHLVGTVDCFINCPITNRSMGQHQCINDSQYEAKRLLMLYTEEEIFEALL